MDKLTEARAAIDRADRELAPLFEARMRACAEVAAYKRERGLPVYDAARERRVLEEGLSRVGDPALQRYYGEFLRGVLTLSKQYQTRLLGGDAVGFQGAPGAFSHLALQTLYPGATERAYDTFEELCRAVESGEIARGVLPFENSYTGEVGEVHDLLFRRGLQVIQTLDLRITHQLLGLPGAALTGVKRVYSHPQAIEQCRGFLESHGFEPIPVLNTASAARRVGEEGDPSAAAIASQRAGELYGLVALAPDISASRDNTTRFVVAEQARPNEPIAHGDHFALMFTLDHATGRLAGVMQAVARHGFNMECIRSKPLRDLPWQYYFYAELAGDGASPEAAALLAELLGLCRELKLLGSYCGRR